MITGPRFQEMGSFLHECLAESARVLVLKSNVNQDFICLCIRMNTRKWTEAHMGPAVVFYEGFITSIHCNRSL